VSPPKKRAPPSRKGATEKKKLLLVEDYEDAREMYQEYLEFSGYEVEVAKDGAEAVARAQASHPDLILMDMSLPLVSGWEATRLLKGDVKTADIPVIALTGHVLADHSAKAKEAGCDEFLGKPALPQDVAQSVRDLLAKARLKSKTKGDPETD
jgi:CheY-like chemotaxis protein